MRAKHSILLMSITTSLVEYVALTYGSTSVAGHRLLLQKATDLTRDVRWCEFKETF